MNDNQPAGVRHPRIEPTREPEDVLEWAASFTVTLSMICTFVLVCWWLRLAIGWWTIAPAWPVAIWLAFVRKVVTVG